MPTRVYDQNNQVWFVEFSPKKLSSERKPLVLFVHVVLYVRTYNSNTVIGVCARSRIITGFIIASKKHFSTS